HPRLDVPALVQIVVVCRLEIGRQYPPPKDPRIIQLNAAEDLGRTQCAAIRLKVRRMTKCERDAVNVPSRAEERADFLELGDQVLVGDIDEQAHKRVGELVQVPRQLPRNLEIECSLTRGHLEALDPAIDV